MPTMIRPKRTFATNNATATTQNARSLSGSNLPGRIDRLVKRTENPLPRPRQRAGSGCPRLPRKRREAYFMDATDDGGARWGARGSRSVNKKRGSLEPRKIVGADNGASAYPLRGSAPALAACRRPRQLAKNAPRFLYARSFAGSSPCDGPITKKLPLLGALSSNGAGERT